MILQHLPNLISLGRILLVGPVIWALASERYGLTLLLFSVAGFSDALDGYLAKHFGWTSRLGSLLDPAADKLLLVGTFLTLGWLHALPWWLVLVVILRDLVILGGALAYRLLIGPFAGQPNLASKVNTFLQICLVIAVLIERGLGPLPAGVITALGFGVVLFALLSGGRYVLDWSRLARSAHRAVNRPPPR